MQGFLKLSTQVTITVLIVDSSDHVTGKTGLSAGLTITASKAGTYSSTPITPTVAELDATNAKGMYSLVLTTTHTNTLGELLLHITATGADPADYWWQVSTYLPGEAATLQADQAVNTTKVGGTTQTARDIGASVLLSSGTGAGQLDFTSGIVKANLAQILGTALTETAGQIAAGFKKVFDVGVPVFTAASVNQTGDAFARLGAPAGASVSADIAAAKVDTAAVKVQTDKLTFTVANQIDANVLDWKSATAPAMTGDAFARLGAPVVTVSADLAAAKADTAAIKLKTDNLPGAPAAVGSAMTLTSGERNSVADALLDRDMSTGTDSGSTTVRTPRQALRFLRNLWSIAAGTLTVMKEDDATTSWTGAATQTAGNPVSSIDPAGP